MPKVTIYHNPRCSKSRQTLELLRDRNADIDVVEYLKTPLNNEELAELARLLGTADHLIREQDRRKLGLPRAEGEAEVLDQIAEHPELMQRPIVVYKGRARIGRPPESVLEIL